MSDKTYQPSINALRTFVSLAQHRHFGAAATELGVTQPTLSQALGVLETGLGCRLIDRTTRRVLVPPEGESLLPKAIAALDAVDEFVAAADRNHDALTGIVRMGVIPTVAPYILPTVLTGLAAELPELRPQIIEDQTARLLAALRDGTLDVAVLALPTEEPGLTEIPMYAEDFVLALPADHPMSGRSRISPRILADLPLLLLDEGHCLRDQALEVCSLAGVEVEEGRTRAASLTTAVHCVAGGLGVTLIPRTAVASETASGRLVTVEFTRPRPGRRIGLVCRSSAGRDADYRRLAGIVADLVAADGAARHDDETASLTL